MAICIYKNDFTFIVKFSFSIDEKKGIDDTFCLLWFRFPLQLSEIFICQKIIWIRNDNWLNGGVSDGWSLSGCQSSGQHWIQRFRTEMVRHGNDDGFILPRLSASNIIFIFNVFNISSVIPLSLRGRPYTWIYLFILLYLLYVVVRFVKMASQFIDKLSQRLFQNLCPTFMASDLLSEVEGGRDVGRNHCLGLTLL